ncbi:MAG TPA: hypothetical protein VMU50_02675 [Polyangia bacterium]|nr:hypothetical protein [Polyangia bacterium]
MRRVVLIAALATLAGCRTYETASDYCEKDKDCNGRGCDPIKKHCLLAAIDGSGGGRVDADAAPPDVSDAPAEEAAFRCATDDDCRGTATPACDTTSGACVSCTDNYCAKQADGGTPVCVPATGACVECGPGKACQEVGKPLCSPAGICVPCSTAGAGLCKDKDKMLPACNLSSGACVRCASVADCLDKTTPFCSADQCVGCGSAGNTACMQLNSKFPICSSSGACVECGVDDHCSATSTRPFCGRDSSCVGCDMAPAGPNACAAHSPQQPVCNRDTGSCVQCLTNNDCGDPTMPVCGAMNKCGPCAKDGDCAGRGGPVVCLSHLGGRCAVESETIYIHADGSCSDTGGGTADMPFCTMQPSIAAVGPTRDVIILRGNIVGPASAYSGGAQEISIIGQSSAVVSPGLRFTGARAFVRDLKIGPSSTIGVQADGGSTLQLEHVVIDRAGGGGILIDGAAFSIRNTTVTNNGPGTAGAITWGGILINNPPAQGMAQLQLSTIQGNNPVGVSCSGMVTPTTNVLVTGNTSVQITLACGFSSCSAPSSTCGTQP